MAAPLEFTRLALICVLPLALLAIVAVVGLVVYLAVRLRNVLARLGELEQRVRHLETGGQGPDEPRPPRTTGIREPLR